MSPNGYNLAFALLCLLQVAKLEELESNSAKSLKIADQPKANFVLSGKLVSVNFAPLSQLKIKIKIIIIIINRLFSSHTLQ